MEKKLIEKNGGEVHFVAGGTFLILLCIIVTAQLEIYTMAEMSHIMEDALAMSNLASALPDVEEYGISHRILIKDFEKAYDVFCRALKGNLGLNDSWEKDERLFITGRVKVECYMVYNVFDDVVYVCGKDENGNLINYSAGLGSVAAPNGKVIETTSVYSEISFPVSFFPGVEQTAHKGKLVDICSN